MVSICTEKTQDLYSKLESFRIIPIEGNPPFNICKLEEPINDNYYIIKQVNGPEYETFICSAPTEEECKKIIQNIYHINATREPYLVMDINDFRTTETKDYTFEDIQETMLSIMEKSGYTELVNLYEDLFYEKYNNENCKVNEDLTTNTLTNVVDDIITDKYNINDVKPINIIGGDVNGC